MEWKQEFKEKTVSPSQAVRLIQSGDKVYVGTCTSVCYELMRSLWDYRHEIENITLQCSQILKPCELYDAKEDNPFHYETYFTGVGERKARSHGLPLDYTSFHLSQVDIWAKEIAKPDVCFFDVSEPDENGFMSYGLSGIALHEYLKETTKTIIVQVNRKTPYIFGEKNKIHISEVDAVVLVDEEAAAIGMPDIDNATRELSKIIAEQVDDGSTLQLGLGNIATAIGLELQNKNDLGIYTELLSEPMVTLVMNGNVTNKNKGFMPDVSVFAFALGSEKMYQYLHKNRKFYGAPFPFVNDARNIAKNKKMISINNAMSFDIFGQAAADSIGWHQQSGVGGQLDFVRGAQWSEGGKSIIATTSTTIKNGKRISRILPFLPEGTAVTTPRADIQYVATEFGCVNLKVLNMKDRIKAMIGLAHPDFRAWLEEEAKRLRLI